MRNRKNYEEDLKAKDFKQTGIKEDSFVNLIFLCHATISLGIDIMHDVFEGISHYNLCEIILAFIRDDYCTLDELNRLKADLSYGDVENGDKSPPITMERLQSRRLLMSASEMQCFAHHFSLIVGDLIPDQNYPVWKFLLETIKFVDLLFLPSYTEQDLNKLATAIATMNSMYKRIFGVKLKPKHHHVTHYPTMIRRFGPLYYISSIRYEAKHKVIKNYTKNTSSRINISYSLGKKLQYNFAYRLIQKTGLEDNVELGRSKYFRLETSPFFEQFQTSQELVGMRNKNLMETSKVIVNGILFSKKLYVTLNKNGLMCLLSIDNILYASDKFPTFFSYVKSLATFSSMKIINVSK